MEIHILTSCTYKTSVNDSNSKLKLSLNFCRCKNAESYGSFSSLKAPGNSSSLSGKANFRNYSNRNRTPFHKRYKNCCILFTVNRDSLLYESRSDSSLSKSKDRYSNQPTSSKFNIRFVSFISFSFCLHFYHVFDSGLRLSSF